MECLTGKWCANAQAFTALDGPAKLVACLRHAAIHEDAHMVQHAVCLLAVLSKMPDLREPLGLAGAVDVIVDLLSDAGVSRLGNPIDINPDYVKERAATALVHLTSGTGEAANRRRLRDAGVRPTLRLRKDHMGPTCISCTCRQLCYDVVKRSSCSISAEAQSLCTASSAVSCMVGEGVVSARLSASYQVVGRHDCITSTSSIRQHRGVHKAQSTHSCIHTHTVSYCQSLPFDRLLAQVEVSMS
jgi:hypothetical protein